MLQNKKENNPLEDKKVASYDLQVKDLVLSDIIRMITDKQKEIDSRLKELVNTCLGE